MAWVDRIGPASFVVQLPYDRSAPQRTRALLAHVLAGASATPDKAADAELVAHELVINGLTHGSPAHDDRIEVSAEVVANELRVSVRDGGSNGTVAPRPFTTDLPGGRGLAMVEVLCSRWAVDRSAGTCVTAWLTL